MSMQAEVKFLDIKAGKPVVILNDKDAAKMSIFLGERVELSFDGQSIISIVDISDEIPEGKIVLFEEAKEGLDIDEGSIAEVNIVEKPESVDYIRKKVDGDSLSEVETTEIISDTVTHKLTDPELMAYMIALHMSDFSMEEAKNLTNAMVKTGEQIDFDLAVDKHCIGGVPGNRTTPLVVSIIAAAGYKIPKTSSRAITSPAGTADTMEVLMDVDFSAEKIKEIVEETNGCMIWGGGVDLAPADDEFIRVRESLSLDPLEQVLASVMAKKKSVSSDHVLIDIPMGRGAKIHDKEKANSLAKYFQELGEGLGMEVVTMISDGSQPIGQGIGPALEARDVLKILESNGEQGPEDLKDKAIRMADLLLKQVDPSKDAEEILESGAAHEKFKEIIEAQKGEAITSDKVELGDYFDVLHAKESGRVKNIHNHAVTRIAKAAGCPKEKKSGVYLHKKVDDPVEEGEELITVYSENEKRLENAMKEAKESKIFDIESFLSR